MHQLGFIVDVSLKGDFRDAPLCTLFFRPADLPSATQIANHFGVLSQPRGHFGNFDQPRGCSYGCGVGGLLKGLQLERGFKQALILEQVVSRLADNIKGAHSRPPFEPASPPAGQPLERVRHGLHGR